MVSGVRWQTFRIISAEGHKPPTAAVVLSNLTPRDKLYRSLKVQDVAELTVRLQTIPGIGAFQVLGFPVLLFWAMGSRRVGG